MLRQMEISLLYYGTPKRQIAYLPKSYNDIDVYATRYMLMFLVINADYMVKKLMPENTLSAFAAALVLGRN